MERRACSPVSAPAFALCSNATLPLQVPLEGVLFRPAVRAAFHHWPRISDSRSSGLVNPVLRSSSPVTSSWCCLSCCAAYIFRCAISIGASNWPPQALGRAGPGPGDGHRYRCLLPGLVSGWLFAASCSFNEFTASLFVTVGTDQTFPVAMYNYVRDYADPSMAALAVMYIVADCDVCLRLRMRFLGLGRCSMLSAYPLKSSLAVGSTARAERAVCGAF